MRRRRSGGQFGEFAGGGVGAEDVDLFAQFGGWPAGGVAGSASAVVILSMRRMTGTVRCSAGSANTAGLVEEKRQPVSAGSVMPLAVDGEFGGCRVVR